MHASAESKIREYLADLNECLKDYSIADPDTIVGEIGTYIRERVQESNHNIDEILQSLGSTQGVALRYARSGSMPVLLALRPRLERVKRVTQWVVLFLCASIGYGVGYTLLGSAILISRLPHQATFWPHRVTSDWRLSTALSVGSVIVCATTYGICRFCKTHCEKRPRLAKTTLDPDDV